MLLRVPLCVLAFSAFAFSQQPAGATNQQLLDELKGIRNALERIEKSQQALIAIQRMSLDQAHLAALEEQRSKLLAQQRSLSTSVVVSNRRTGKAAAAAITSADAESEHADTADNAAEARSAEASRRLDAVQRALSLNDQELNELKRRIADWEKILQGS